MRRRNFLDALRSGTMAWLAIYVHRTVVVAFLMASFGLFDRLGG